MHHPKSSGFLFGNRQTANGNICPGGRMLLQHDFVVHFIDMVTGQNDDIFDTIAVNDIDVLRNGIGGAAIPIGFIHPLRGRKDIKIFVAFRPQKPPTALHMTDQGMRLILRRNGHLANTGIQRIRQSKVNNPRLATEIHGRLGATVGQFFQA